MTRPCVTLRVKRRQTGSKDDRNNPVVTFGQSAPWQVFAVAPGANVDPGNPNRDLSLILWTVYAPANSSAPAELDRVVLNGDEYEVEGRPKDWTHGPWANPVAGIVVELKRAEG